MDYRPQAYETAERMVHKITDAIKLYVEDVNQKDWDRYAERLTFALNMSYDWVRDETPYFITHGWDAQTTLDTTLSVGFRLIGANSDARRWRYSILRQYQWALQDVAKRLHNAQQERADRHNESVDEEPIVVGSQVWLYI